MKNATKLPMFPVGALEVILECQEILAGQRTQLTRVNEYKQQRLRYWQMQALRPRQAAGKTLQDRAA